MCRGSEGTTIATVTDLRRPIRDLLVLAEDGFVVVVQNQNEPQGVYLSSPRYEAMLERLTKLENLEMAEVAVARKEAVDRGETATTALADMIAAFAPELLARERRGA